MNSSFLISRLTCVSIVFAVLSYTARTFSYNDESLVFVKKQTSGKKSDAGVGGVLRYSPGSLMSLGIQDVNSGSVSIGLFATSSSVSFCCWSKHSIRSDSAMSCGVSFLGL